MEQANFDRVTGTYLILSSKGKGHGAYRVDLAAESCTCPHFTYRLQDKDTGLVCKHVATVRQQVALGQVAA